MIRGRLSSFQQRCKQRGVPFEQARQCIVEHDGDMVLVDESHPAYPSSGKPRQTFDEWLQEMQGRSVDSLRGLSLAASSGPGTELKKLLAKIGITATPTCSCNARARRMDVEESREPGWCEAHLDEIVGWLREEAEKRKLPFVDMAGRMLVRRAIKNARKAAASS